MYQTLLKFILDSSFVRMTGKVEMTFLFYRKTLFAFFFPIPELPLTPYPNICYRSDFFLYIFMVWDIYIPMLIDTRDLIKSTIFSRCQYVLLSTSLLYTFHNLPKHFERWIYISLSNYFFTPDTRISEKIEKIIPICSKISEQWGTCWIL